MATGKPKRKMRTPPEPDPAATYEQYQRDLREIAVRRMKEDAAYNEGFRDGRSFAYWDVLTILLSAVVAYLLIRKFYPEITE
jgi:hypothetical protein